jgi:hypothetical protein
LEVQKLLQKVRRGKKKIADVADLAPSRISHCHWRAAEQTHKAQSKNGT